MAKNDSAATLADTYLPSDKQFSFIRPSVTPKQIAENTQAYGVLHAEGSLYPFCIISLLPSPATNLSYINKKQQRQN
jgi:hypothetical protein